MIKSHKLRLTATAVLAFATSLAIAAPAMAAPTEPGRVNYDRDVLRYVCRLGGGTFYTYPDGSYSCTNMPKGDGTNTDIFCEPNGSCIVWFRIPPYVPPTRPTWPPVDPPVVRG
jgi:hypothetical protein